LKGTQHREKTFFSGKLNNVKITTNDDLNRSSLAELTRDEARRTDWQKLFIRWQFSRMANGDSGHVLDIQIQN
jgi:hypothetical protein